jgi:hypothetical protein
MNKYVMTLQGDSVQQVTAGIAVVLNVTPSSLMDRYQSFGRCAIRVEATTNSVPYKLSDPRHKQPSIMVTARSKATENVSLFLNVLHFSGIFNFHPFSPFCVLN